MHSIAAMKRSKRFSWHISVEWLWAQCALLPPHNRMNNDKIIFSQHKTKHEFQLLCDAAFTLFCTQSGRYPGGKKQSIHARNDLLKRFYFLWNSNMYSKCENFTKSFIKAVESQKFIHNAIIWQGINVFAASCWKWSWNFILLRISIMEKYNIKYFNWSAVVFFLLRFIHREKCGKNFSTFYRWHVFLFTLFNE